MSRSGYSEDFCDESFDYIRYRGQVESAIRGKRGQQFFRDLVAALDAMPEKKLSHGFLVTPQGDCASACVGRYRGLKLITEFQVVEGQRLHAEPEEVAKMLNIAEQLARETMWMNDEFGDDEKPERRWSRIRSWAAKQIRVRPEELLDATT